MQNILGSNSNIGCINRKSKLHLIIIVLLPNIISKHL